MKAIHHHLCQKFRVYHRWHQHPLHKHVHWGVLGAVALGVALSFVILGWSEDAADFTRAVHAASINTADIPTIRSRYLQYGFWGGEVDPSWKSCPDYNNWWENEVGWPHYIADAILTNKISRSEWESALRCYIGKQSTGEPQGANAVWRGMTRLAAGLALDDVGYLNWAVDRIAGSISQGDYSHITHDWGYHFHYDVPNLGYGMSHFGEFANYLKISEGTSFAIDAGVFFDWVGKGLIWQSINKRYDPYLSAKFPHKWYNWDGAARTLLTTGYPQVATIRQGLEAMANGGNAPYGARSFPQSTYVIARRPSFLVSVKLVNPFEPFLEASNYAPVFGAVNIVNTATVGRIEGAQMLDNPAGLLSTMTMPKKYTKHVATPDTEYSDRALEWEVLDAIQKPNPWPHIGVSTLGGYYGIAGQAMKKPGEWAMKRSWFLMDNEVVTLGSGISAGGNSGGMETWLETMKSAPASVGVNRMTHGGIGYALLSSNGSTLKSRPGGSGDPNIKSGYTQAYLDHGSNPNGASFALVLLPNASETASYSGTEVLRLDDQAHIVKDTSSGVIGAAFFAPGSGGGITTNEPGYIMMQAGNELQLSVFNSMVEESLRGPAPKVYSSDKGGTNPFVDFEKNSSFTANQYQISVPFRLQKAGSGQGLNLFSLSGSNPTTISATIRVGRKLELKGTRNSDGSYTIAEASIGFNDADAGVTPGGGGNGGCIPSTEVCDGKDNDCDGDVDEGNVCGTTNQPPQNLVLRYLGPTPTGGNLCGNPPGRIDPGEQCDGTNLNNQTCQSQGFSSGTLTCTSSCTFNTSQCTNPPPPGQTNFNPPFPRIGVLYFYEVNIPEEIWKDKDMVAVRYWYPQIAQKVKIAYPDKIVLAANNIIDGVGIFSPTTPPNAHPADPWLVPLAGGTNPYPVGTPYCATGWHMNQHPGNCLYDGTDGAPLLSAYGNKRWNQHLPEYLVDGTDWSVFDGSFWDSWAGGIYTNADKVDFNRNGVVDGPAVVSQQWLESNKRIVENMRGVAPSGKSLQIAHESAGTEYTYLNGRGFEYWKGFNWQWVYDNLLIPYSQNAVSPRINFIEGQVDFFEQYTRMRFGLTTAALTDAYYYTDHSGSAHQFDYRYDEFIGDLGYPTGSATAIRPGVYVRYFDKGAVITNGSGSPQAVSSSDLTGGPYYRFRGGQDPSFNNGQPFTSVQLAGSGAPNNLGAQTGDGIMLFRQPTTLVSEIIVDNVARNMTSPGSNPVIYSGTWTQQDMGQLDASVTLGYALLYGWDQYGPPYAKSTQVGAIATYQPTIGVAGTYDVYEWHPNTSADGQGAGCSNIQVRYSGMTCTGWQGTINQTAGSGQWNKLGTCTMSAGTTGTVTLTAPGGCAAASDAIKFVYRGP